jgi:hypothetical protein
MWSSARKAKRGELTEQEVEIARFRAVLNDTITSLCKHGCGYTVITFDNPKIEYSALMDLCRRYVGIISGTRRRETFTDGISYDVIFNPG